MFVSRMSRLVGAAARTSFLALVHALEHAEHVSGPSGPAAKLAPLLVDGHGRCEEVEDLSCEHTGSAVRERRECTGESTSERGRQGAPRCTAVQGVPVGRATCEAVRTRHPQTARSASSAEDYGRGL